MSWLVAPWCTVRAALRADRLTERRDQQRITVGLPGCHGRTRQVADGVQDDGRPRARSEILVGAAPARRSIADHRIGNGARRADQRRPQCDVLAQTGRQQSPTVSGVSARSLRRGRHRGTRSRRSPWIARRNGSHPRCGRPPASCRTVGVERGEQRVVRSWSRLVIEVDAGDGASQHAAGEHGQREVRCLGAAVGGRYRRPASRCGTRSGRRCRSRTGRTRGSRSPSAARRSRAR